jgi:hypothetical protein
VELELFRANAIEADDTSSVRIRMPGAPPVVIAVTLCAPAAGEFEPWLLVRGTRGTARFDYTTDVLTVRDAAGERVRTYPRVGLLENLLDHLAAPAQNPLLAPLAAFGPFTALVQAVADAPEPTPIPPEYRSIAGTGAGEHVVITDVVSIVERCGTSFRLFSEAGAPWTTEAAAR